MKVQSESPDNKTVATIATKDSYLRPTDLGPSIDPNRTKVNCRLRGLREYRSTKAPRATLRAHSLRSRAALENPTG